MRRRHLAAVVLAVAAAFGLWRLCYLPYRCNVEKKILVARSERAMRAREAAPTLRAARGIVAQANELLAICPDDIDLLMIRAANQRMVGDFADAANSYRVALDIQKRQELYYELGATELVLDDRRAAIEAFTNCVRFYPSQIANIEDPQVRAAVEARVFTRR
jgi:tetratricopeptide (TPR) repeat protein